MKLGSPSVRVLPALAVVLAATTAAPLADARQAAKVQHPRSALPTTVLGWRGRWARLEVAGRRQGQPVVRVALAASRRHQMFSAYRWPRPVPSTAAGAKYRANAWAKGLRGGRRLCLRVREIEHDHTVARTTRCTRTTGRWQKLPTVEHRARRAGSSLGLIVLGRRGKRPNRFSIGATGLELANGGFVGRRCAVDCGPPVVVTGASAAVSASAAALSGTLNANGSPTAYWFELGTTTAYGATTPLQDVGAGVETVVAAATATGLSGGTTYHYRLVAVNALGRTLGGDVTFTTASPAQPQPPASPPPPSVSPPPPAPRP
ncbi:MAG TPA: hypothetical protein VKB00_07050, partial [Candidatus Limnocylindrales bacterium]|nr:hypothetical protein [Candidatus Limnocylindrales bacterium]